MTTAIATAVAGRRSCFIFVFSWLASGVKPEARSLISHACALLEPGVHRDLRVEELGDGTAALRVLHGLVERRLVGVRDSHRRLQMAGGDRETAFHLFQAHRGRRVDAVRLHAGVAELRRQRHRKTGGVRRGYQLLGVRPLLTLEPLAEVVRNIRQDAALRRDVPGPILEPTLPHGTTAALHTRWLLLPDP